MEWTTKEPQSCPLPLRLLFGWHIIYPRWVKAVRACRRVVCAANRMAPMLAANCMAPILASTATTSTIRRGRVCARLRRMKRTAWQQRVAADSEIHHGEPCIVGTRIPVRMIVGSLADGLTAEQIVAEYPQLTSDDISAALAYAAEVLHQQSLLPLTALFDSAKRC